MIRQKCFYNPFSIFRAYYVDLKDPYLIFSIDMTDPPLIWLENEFGKLGLCRECRPTVLNDGMHGSIEEWVPKAGNIWKLRQVIIDKWQMNL